MGLAILANTQLPLGSGGVVNQLRSIILGSSEYLLVRGGGTVSGFVNAIYHDVLGRNPDAAGGLALTQFLANGGSPTVAARLYLTSLEADANLVNSLFGLYLHRQPRPGELSSFEFALFREQISELDATAIILGSAEFASGL